MNKLGAQIPTAWFLIIPIVNIWWLWKYSEGVDQVTKEKLSTPITFLLAMLLGTIGYAVIQHEFNNLGEATVQPLVSESEQNFSQQTVNPESSQNQTAPFSESIQPATTQPAPAETMPVESAGNDFAIENSPVPTEESAQAPESPESNSTFNS